MSTTTTDNAIAAAGQRVGDERVHTVSTIANDGVMWIDAASTITYANPPFARMVGHELPEIIGRPVTDFMDEAAAAEFAQRLDRRRAGVAETYEIRLRRIDGSLISTRISAWPILDPDKCYRGSVGVISDPSELNRTEQAVRRSEAALGRSNRALRALSAVNRALIAATDETSLLQRMCQVIVDLGGYRMAWIGFAQTDADQSVAPVAVAGHDEGYVAGVRVSWADNERGQGATGRAIRTGTTQINTAWDTDPRNAPWREAARQRGYAASAVFPLRGAQGVSNGVLGAFSIYAADPDAFHDEELALLNELADDVSFGIGVLRDREARDIATKRWQSSMEAAVSAIANTVEARDRYTTGHQQRTAKLAAAIATALGLTTDAIHGLYLAGLIHDVGKIGIPGEILSKPGKLSKAEFELVKTHAQAGYEIVKDIAFPWPISLVIHQHHERLDGSGYPQGLKGDAILMEARILAVADVVEAMTSFRPYRVALGIDAALAEIEKNRGRFYDPVVADCCIELFRSGKFVFAG